MRSFVSSLRLLLSWGSAVWGPRLLVYGFVMGIGIGGLLPSCSEMPERTIDRHTVAGTTDLTTADLDGDGDSDVLATLEGEQSGGWFGQGEGKVVWYEHRGEEGQPDSSRFGPQQVITTRMAAPQSVAAADLDGDGDPDLLAASHIADEIVWYENQRGGSADSAFRERARMTDDAAYTITTADLDGDGDADVLAAGAKEVVWYENQIGETRPDSNGIGPRRVIATQRKHATSIVVADVDRDGAEDVLTASVQADDISSSGDTVSISPQKNTVVIAWHENQIGKTGGANNGFGSQRVIKSTREVHPGGRDVLSVADLDGDRAPDVIAALGDRVVWYENQVRAGEADGDGFGPQQTIASSVSPSAVTTADVDQDGAPDVVCALSFDGAAWYENQIGGLLSFAGEFGFQKTITSNRRRHVVTADLDNDGVPDVLTANKGLGKQNINWYENQEVEKAMSGSGKQK